MIRLIWLTAIVLLLLCIGGGICSGQTLKITGDENSMWVLRRETEGPLKVFHRKVTDPHEQLRIIKLLQGGQIASGGIACIEDRLWVVYKGSESYPKSDVISLRLPPPNAFEPPGLERKSSLPIGIVLKALTTTRDGPWALLRVENRETLVELDASLLSASSGDQTPPPPPVPETPNPITPGPGDENSDSDPTPGVPDPGPTPDQPAHTQSPQLVRVDRLVRLDHNRWVNVALPDDWPHDAPGWLVMRRSSDRYPLLIATPKGESQATAWAYQYNGSTWKKERYLLTAKPERNVTPPDITPNTAPDTTPKSIPESIQKPTPETPKITATGPLSPGPVTDIISVDDQLILGRTRHSKDRLQVDLFILRSGSATRIGVLTIPALPTRQWGLTQHGPNVALIVSDENNKLRWTCMNLQGQVSIPLTELSAPIPSPLSDTADYLVVIPVLGIATLIMIVVWRRDQSENRVQLPKNVELADLSRRAVAAGIDLLPGLGVMVFYYSVPPLELHRYWPGFSVQWDDMLPGAVAIALFIVHTILSELLTGKTLGKAITGVRVTNLEGKPPDLWQVLIRGVMKVLDMIAWLLLILPLIGPYRQRLGDLVAKTVVIRSVETTPKDQDKKTDEGTIKEK